MNLAVSCGSTYATRKVWGFADVAEDGSAYFKVPAERAIFFLALDDQGRAVQRMRSYTHLMPGEVQGCVGCHASRNYLPPLGLAKELVRRPPQELEPPEWWTEAGFAYERIVQPVLDKNCIECHSGAEAPKAVRLTGDRTQFFSTSYDTLAMGTKMAPPHRYRGQNGLIDNPYTDWISGFHGCEDNILEVEPRHPHVDRCECPVLRFVHRGKRRHGQDGAPAGAVTVTEVARRRDIRTLQSRPLHVI